MTKRLQVSDVRFDTFDGEKLELSPNMRNIVLPALAEIVSDVRSGSRGRFSLEVFGRDILPLLMSEDPDEQQLGRQHHFTIANNNPFNEVELVDNHGNVIFILPPAMMRIPSLRGHLGDYRPIADAKSDFMIAHAEDMMFGREPSSLNSETGEVYRSLADEYQDICDPMVLIEWDKIVTYFGYPSFFKPEEKQVLIAKGLTVDWSTNPLATPIGKVKADESESVQEEESYEEDDWEV